MMNTKTLPWNTLAAGVLGFTLALLFSIHGETSLYLLLWVLTVGFIGLLVWRTRALKQAPKYSFNFPPSLWGAVGTAAAAVGVLTASINKMFSATDALASLDVVLGFSSVAALVFLSVCRWKGNHPSAVFHAIICLYLMVDLVSVYRLRSSDPQVWEYCFSLLASVTLMLSCYYDAEFAANTGNRNKQALSHMAAVFLCLLSLPSAENPIFYLTMAVWMFTNLCNLTPMPRNTRK